MTKVSALTFARGYRKRIQLEKTLCRFPDFINKKYFALILTMMILIKCSGKLCYRHGNIQNTEAATGGVLKIQIKVSQNSWENTYARVSFLIKLQALDLQLYLKKRLRHRCLPVNFVKFLRTPFWKAAVSQNMKAYM